MMQMIPMDHGAQLLSAQLDEALEQTFPASDPPALFREERAATSAAPSIPRDDDAAKPSASRCAPSMKI